MNEQIKNFVDEVGRSISTKTFVKLTLANYKGPEEHLQRISIRRIETKKGEKLEFQSRFATRDVVKNFHLRQAADLIRSHLENGFRSAHLFTTENDIQLIIGKKNARLVKGKPSLAAVPSASHDREKKYIVDPSAYYLKALRVTTDSGEVRKDQQDKWRQINKFVEIVDGLIKNSTLKDRKAVRIVDMGSGKGYLTFALYDYLKDSSAEITGVEKRKELVTLCIDIAQTSGFDGLSFVQGTIADFDPGDVDILIALHACDTATDDALYKGIKTNASIIVAAPCCHHELKKQMKPPELLAGIMKHPVMLERTAETITDGIRSLLLEANGYKTRIFEFVATEHTPKNNMLVATRVGSPLASERFRPGKRVEVEAIMTEFGIAHQRLAELIERGEQTDAI